MKKKIIIVLLAGLGLVSCDKQSSFEKTITNSSGYDLVIYSNESIYAGNVSQGAPEKLYDSLLINNNSTEIIHAESDFGSVNNYSDCKGHQYTSFIDSVKILSTPTKTLTFDINTTTKWLFNVEREDLSGHGACNCKLEILDSDVQ